MGPPLRLNLLTPGTVTPCDIAGVRLLSAQFGA